MAQPTDIKGSATELQAKPALELAPSSTSRLSSSQALVALAAFTVAAGVGYQMLAGTQTTSGRHSNHPLITVAGEDYPGAIVLIDADLARDRPYVVRDLEMGELERQRVAVALRSGPTRIAAITLWDIMDEDGDTVDIIAAGFSQRVSIRNAPKTYFVPVFPGAPVRITAVTDGGGGGITLGVKTAIGPVPLPFLAVGQSIEVPSQ